jgi:hypothetical protein
MIDKISIFHLNSSFKGCFTPRLPKEGDVIQCPDCKVWTEADQWDDTCIYCEMCGDHSAFACPACGLTVDHVYHNEDYPKAFNVKEKESDDVV